MNCAEVTEELVAFVKGDLTDSREESVAVHLRECDDCRKESDRMVRMLAELSGASEAKVAEKVHALFNEVLDLGASDIHFEPSPEGMRVRVRIDGALREHDVIPQEVASAWVAQIKKMADMQILQRRIPQEGRVQITRNDRRFDVRIATIPVMGGSERLTAGIFVPYGNLRTLDHLGLSEEQRKRVSSLLAAPHGLILIVGPPRSGRTTVAYAMLQALVEDHGETSNIMTVESVCELWLGRGVNQVVLDRKMGMTYSDALRVIMNQDLDSVMIDEIDSPETARTSLNVALTGHLVIGVMRAHDVVHAIAQLREWGIDPFSLSSELIGAVASRLTRKICSLCSELYRPLPHILQQLNITPNEATRVRRGKGCDHCRRGLAGRQGIYEVVAADANFSGLLLREADEDELKRSAFPDNRGSLNDTAKKSVLSGLTTPEEALRSLVVKW